MEDCLSPLVRRFCPAYLWDDERVERLHDDATPVEAVRPVSDLVAAEPPPGYPVVCIMRHSKRLDEKGHLGISPEQWPDRLTRPYDPPISDHELPREAARQLRAHGMGKFDVIACSPYRRTLQTAGIVARELHVRRIVVDNRLGEVLSDADRCWAPAGLAVGNYTYLTEAEAAEWAEANASSGGPELSWQRDENPVLAHPDDVQQRVRQLPQICAAAVEASRLEQSSASVLVVTHGGLLNSFAPGFDWDPGVGRYRAIECGWVACRDFEPLPMYEGDTVPLVELQRVIATQGVESM